ncbi:MAG: hypothetical protein WBB85_07725 [Albidovulum sp.]|jgi:hypothetical protein|uniref:hypothetical protein n=1 Tax=Albidovulum sp. TaxID=1872424 RepID=UPI003CB758E9
MRPVLIILASLALASCKGEEQKLDSGLAGYDPHLVDTARAACLKKDGRFGAGSASGTFVCYENTRDANKSCSKSSDCEGLCLARSQSCSPIKPLPGCNEVLTDNGTIATVCIE